MRILFVSSGNIARSQGVLVKNAKIQGDSLARMGCDINFYFIVGRGIWGYLKNVPRMRKFIKNGGYDIIHAHYSFTGILASFTSDLPMIVSLMGSDLHISRLMTFVTSLFCKYRWRKVIVKTEQMKEIVNFNNVSVIPNGVDLDIFKPVAREEALEKINNDGEKKIILFVSDVNRKEKNFKLAQDAVCMLKRDDVVLLPVENVDHSQIKWYLNACELLLLTSLREGSVNIIKEAMACNVKVVSTKVGDVEKNMKDVPGYYLSGFETSSVAENINKALNYSGPVEGRKKIIELGLDSSTINNRIFQLYKDIYKMK